MLVTHFGTEWTADICLPMFNVRLELAILPRNKWQIQGSEKWEHNNSTNKNKWQIQGSAKGQHNNSTNRNKWQIQGSAKGQHNNSTNRNKWQIQDSEEVEHNNSTNRNKWQIQGSEEVEHNNYFPFFSLVQVLVFNFISLFYQLLGTLNNFVLTLHQYHSIIVIIHHCHTMS